MPESLPEHDKAEIKIKLHRLKRGQNKLRRETEKQEEEHQLGKRSTELTGKMEYFFSHQPRFLKTVVYF